MNETLIFIEIVIFTIYCYSIAKESLKILFFTHLRFPAIHFLKQLSSDII